MDDNNYIGVGWSSLELWSAKPGWFATTLTGWEQQPSISFGHAFARTALRSGQTLLTNVLYLTEGKIHSPPLIHL
jgi:hypothetical protein